MKPIRMITSFLTNEKIHTSPFIYWIVGLFFLLQSCTGVKKTMYSLEGYEKSNCYHQSDYKYTIDEMPKPLERIAMDSVLRNRFSSGSLNVGNAIGLLDLLAGYIAEQKMYMDHPTNDLRINMLKISQLINQKIITSSLEISSVVSELDCEEERASQIANFLKDRAGQREKKLVIASIVIGAAGVITGEILANNKGNAGSFVSLGTGLTGATLGALMLVNNQKITFNHSRNTPGEIWNGPPVSKTLPSSIWYYLNYENPSGNSKSLRSQLIANWTKFGQIDTSKTNEIRTIPIYFGQGGKYTASQLQNRANMYDQIASYIALMKQDLKQLSIEVGKMVSN